MKVRVVIKGWNDGFAKISHTKLIKEYTKLPLDLAKKITDNVLADKVEVIEFENKDIALEFCSKAEKLGANCTIEFN